MRVHAYHLSCVCCHVVWPALPFDTAKVALAYKLPFAMSSETWCWLQFAIADSSVLL